MSSDARNAALLTAATLGASIANYGVNLALGHWLSPVEFGDVSFVVATMLVLAACSISVQLVASTIVTKSGSTWAPKIALLSRWVLATSAVLGAIAVTLSPVCASFFNVASPVPFVILGLGLPFYGLLSVGRGVAQGQLQFRRLAATFLVEAIVRAIVTVVAVALGWGVPGAALGLSAAFAGAWFVVSKSTPIRSERRPSARQAQSFRRAVSGIARPISVLLVAQVIVNNEDILFAKRALSHVDAGRYGSIALAGRGIFFVSWAVATAIFPAVNANPGSLGDTSVIQQRQSRLLFGAVMAVAAMGLVAILGTRVFGDVALVRIFGSEYTGLGSELQMYAVATSLFALANLLATFHLALGNSLPAKLLLLGAALQTVLLASRHGSIHDIVEMQVVAMASVTAGIVAQHFAPTRSPRLLPKLARP